MARLGDDLAVALHRQALADKTSDLEQAQDGKLGRQRFGLTIDGDLDHDSTDEWCGRKSYHAWGLTFPAPGAKFAALSADLINSLRALNKYG